jgi:DUF2993 family protein
MRRLAAIGTVALVVVVLGIAQLVLPGIAAQQLRDRLAKHGEVIHVEVDAFPAIELLWHTADKVVIRMASYRSSSGDLGSSLAQANDVGTLDASAAQVDVGLLRLRDASLRKQGNELSGSASVTEADLRASAPFLDNVQPVASTTGQLTLRGTATLLGVTASVDATVAAVQGRLIVQPDVPFGALATFTLFDNPHVAVQQISAQSTASGFNVDARGRVS